MLNLSSSAVKSPYHAKILAEIKRMRRADNPMHTVLPGLVVGKNFAPFVKLLYKRLCSSFPGRELDFTGLFSVPGFRGSPCGACSRAEVWKGPKFELVLRNLHTLGKWAVQYRKHKAVSIKRTSGTSVPYFKSSIELKQAMAEQGLRRIDDILDCVRRRDLDGMLSFDIPLVGGGHTKNRLQTQLFKSVHVVDGVVRDFEHKGRTVFDWTGKNVQVDFRIVLEMFDSYFQKQRPRVIYSKAAQINIIAQFFFTCIHAGMMSEFDIFRHSTLELDLKRMSADKSLPYHMTCDEPEHDKHTHRLLFDTLRAGYVAGGLDSSFRDLLNYNHYSSDICPKDYPPYDDYSFPYHPDDIFEMMYVYDQGNASGQSGVTPENRLIVAAINCAAFQAVDLIPTNDVGLLDFVCNMLPWLAYENASDNTWMATNQPRCFEAFVKGRELIGRPIELDVDKNFLGKDFVPNHMNEVDFVPGIARGITNTINNEYPITLDRRAHFGYGWRQKQEVYAANPDWRQVVMDLDNTCYDILGVTLTDMTSDMSKPYNQPPRIEIMSNIATESNAVPYAVPEAWRDATADWDKGKKYVTPRNWREAELMLDPDKLHYRFTTAEVDEIMQNNPNLIKAFFCMYDEQRVAEFDAHIVNTKPITFDYSTLRRELLQPRTTGQTKGGRYVQESVAF